MPANSDRRIITSQRVVLPDPTRPDGLTVGPAAITLNGHTIEAVETRTGVTPSDAPGSPPVTDFGEHLITPAFNNAHTHVALVGLRGAVSSTVARGNMVEELFYVWEKRLTADDVRALARMGAYECLLSGVGTVWDHYFFADAMVAGLRDVGIGGVIGPALQDRSGPGVPQWEAQLDATERLAQDPSLAADGLAVAVAPHATDTVSADLWRSAADLAQRLNLPVHSHCAQSLEELARRHDEDGCSPVQWLKRLGVLDKAPATLLVHMLYASDPDLKMLDAERHVLGLCPYSQLQFGFPAPLDRWEKLGLPWLVATDAAASNDSMNVQKEMRWAGGWRTAPLSASAEFEAFARDGDLAAANRLWDRRKAEHETSDVTSTPERLLRSVWDVPGKLHPTHRTGVIAPGAVANFAIWDAGHPSMWPGTDLLRALAYNDTTGALHAMIVAGRDRGTAGAFAQSIVQSTDYQDARAEADQRLKALTR